jgi:hypothetical protein
MAQHHLTPSHSVTIDRPLCLVCGTEMWLACVEPHDPTHDKRTFECPVCETSEIAFVEFKPAAEKPSQPVVNAPTNLPSAARRRAARTTVRPVMLFRDQAERLCAPFFVFVNRPDYTTQRLFFQSSTSRHL